jgi:hypothetical protein
VKQPDAPERHPRPTQTKMVVEYVSSVSASVALAPLYFVVPRKPT